MNPIYFINILHNDVNNQQLNLLNQMIGESQPNCSKIISRASFYATNLKRFHQLPRQHKSVSIVKQIAKSEHEQIVYVIESEKAKDELFRQKQKRDMLERSRINTKLHSSFQKIIKNQEKINKDRQQIAQRYSKHLKQAYTKYITEQKRKRVQQKQQSYKLRKQLQQFYQRQEQRKKLQQKKQVSVSTCYEEAINKLNNIHNKNQEYSIKAEIQLNKSLQKNSQRSMRVLQKRNSVSALNKKKPDIMNQSLHIFAERQEKYIQNYGQNQELSMSAWKKIDKNCLETTKRITEFFKKRVEKWKQDKHRIDEAAKQTPSRCNSILQKTSKSFWKPTQSSFSNSARSWRQRVVSNQSKIREMRQKKSDSMIDNHLEISLRNKSIAKVQEKMGSIKMQAKQFALL